MSAIVNLFYLYDPWLFHFLRMGLLVGIVSSLFLVYKWYQKQITKITIPLDSILVVIALIIFSVIPILVNQTKEFGVVSMYIKSLAFFIFGIIIYNLIYQQKSKLQFIKDLEFGVGLQSIIGVLALAGIPFFIQLALGTNADYFLPRFQGSEQEYRLYNLTSSAFFQLSAFYLMLLHFLLAYSEKQYKLNSVYVFLILFVGLISGRTFFMFSVLSLLVYFKLRYLPAIIIFFAFVLFFAINYPTHPYVEHALEPVINLIQGGDRLSSSTDTLMKKHLFMPELKQILMGDGKYYINGRSYYGGSDSGFIRQVLYGGFLYMLVCFLFTAYFIKRIADNWFNGSWKFIISSLLLLSILNVKADTYAYPGIMFVFLMFISLFGNKGKQFIISRKNNV